MGEKVDLSQLTSMAAKVQSEQSTRMMLASEITPREAAFVETGWPPLDDHLNGLPETGLVVVGARPGTGKTWFALTIVYHFLKTHKEKFGIFFSAEMPADELRERLNHMGKDVDTILNRLWIVEDVGDAENIQNLSATIENLGIVVVDYTDMIVTGRDEPSYTDMYTILAKTAKQLRIPLILIAQLSGSYNGGIPRPQNLRYTRLAEALAWMILMLWNPAKDSYEDDGSSASLPVYNNQAYCIAWKSRGGFPIHPDDYPGAILIPFKGESWHPRQSKWFSLAKDDSPQPKRMGKKRSD
jgi:replicative DNA helicase